MAKKKSKRRKRRDAKKSTDSLKAAELGDGEEQASEGGGQPEQKLQEEERQLQSSADGLDGYLGSLDVSDSLEEPGSSFPWVEFLIGAAVGGVFSVIVFVFFVNYAWNLEKRLEVLEYKSASFIEADFDELQQRLFTTMERRLLISENEIRRLKEQLKEQNSRRTLEKLLEKWGILNRLVNLENTMSNYKQADCGSHELKLSQDSATLRHQATFHRNFSAPPIVLVGTTHHSISAVVKSVTNTSCTVEIETSQSISGDQPLLFWLAIEK